MNSSPFTLSGVHYRPITPDDVPAFYDVMMTAGMDGRAETWNGTTPDDLRATLFAPDCGGYLAVDRDGRAVGCVGYRPHGNHTLVLYRLATRPEARGRGVGRQLMNEAEGLANREGYSRLMLPISQFNLGVLPFYEHLGYRRVDERYPFLKEGRPAPVVMVKEFKSHNEDSE